MEHLNFLSSVMAHLRFISRGGQGGRKIHKRYYCGIAGQHFLGVELLQLAPLPPPLYDNVKSRRWPCHPRGKLPKDPTSASVPPLPSHSRPVPPPQSHTPPAPLPPPLRNNVESGRATHARTAFGRAMPWRVNAIKPAANYVGDGYW